MKSARRNLLTTTPATFLIFCASIVSAVPAFAGEILLPSASLERTGPVQLIYKTVWPSSGQGQLSIKWTDVNGRVIDRKSTRLNSSHSQISYAVFCLKKKKHIYARTEMVTDRTD